ncbi:glycosyltransferase family 2 protein [Candidatus Pelagibacter sp.]|uniref:glycosyltransferase family 2 protein n=1 Tax=Candidatus Pelagibacter sp. TaxID=2024849 RepID=UPI003D0A2385
MKKNKFKNRNKISISLLIPIYNEADAVPKLLKKVENNNIYKEVLIIDNNSSDNSFNKVYEYVKKNKNFRLISQKIKGKTNAILKGIKNLNKCDYVAMIDGDNTYDVDEISKLMTYLKDYDVVNGDRISNLNYLKSLSNNYFHYYGNSFITKFYNLMFSDNLKDIFTGLRIFKYDLIKKFFFFRSGFSLETEINCILKLNRIYVKEVPINFKERSGKSKSKLNPIKDGLLIMFCILTNFISYFPFKFFSILGAIFFATSIYFFYFPFKEYLMFNYVYKIPSLIVSVSLFVISLLAFFSGIILENIKKIHFSIIRL